jgi:hypothetical protein
MKSDDIQRIIKNLEVELMRRKLEKQLDDGSSLMDEKDYSLGTLEDAEKFDKKRNYPLK